MKKPENQSPPPLPEEARRALEAFRAERPSTHLESRLHLALRAAETGSSSFRRSPPQRLSWVEHRVTRRVLSLALVTSVIVLSVRTDDWTEPSQVVSETMPLQQVSLDLSGTHPGWLELPWSHGVHSGEPATVHLDVPAGLNVHLPSGGGPAMRLVGCDAGRCVHQFTADTGEGATPLRVRIDKPGRYEFRVSHASDIREVREHFVVEARH